MFCNTNIFICELSFKTKNQETAMSEAEYVQIQDLLQGCGSNGEVIVLFFI